MPDGDPVEVTVEELMSFLPERLLDEQEARRSATAAR